jgi:hypothetical protein
MRRPVCQGILTHMSKDRSPWQLGRRAWERLDGWHLDGRTPRAGHPDDGEGALAALADVGFVRHLLDQAELVAVRTARRHGKSWAEIAVKLGVTRQSAWERWRDLDETTGSASPEGAPAIDGVLEAAVEGVVAAMSAPGMSAAEMSATPAEVLERTARDLRRRSNVRVPNVLGKSFDDARVALVKVGLVAVGPDPDAPPMEVISWPDAKVVDQSPESGAKVPAGTSVTLWVMRGGGSAGVREPRRPLPGPQSAREMRYENDEAVG